MTTTTTTTIKEHEWPSYLVLCMDIKKMAFTCSLSLRCVWMDGCSCVYECVQVCIVADGIAFYSVGFFGRRFIGMLERGETEDEANILHACWGAEVVAWSGESIIEKSNATIPLHVRRRPKLCVYPTSI